MGILQKKCRTTGKKALACRGKGGEKYRSCFSCLKVRGGSPPSNKGSFLLGVIFAKGCEFLLVSLGEGFGVGFRRVAGGGFPVESEREKGNGGGEGGGWGGDGQGNRQVNAQAMSKLLFSNLPFSFFPKFEIRYGTSILLSTSFLSFLFHRA